MCSQILKTISNRTMTLRVANNSHAVFEILGGGAILFTKSPKSQARKCSWFRREGLLREGRLRRHKLHIPRADFSMKSQPSSIPLRFLSHSDPGGGAEWAPDCPSLNCVFGDFLHKQKATRRRHVPLAKTGSPVRRADAPSAPTGAWKIRRSGSFFKSKTGFEYSPPQRALPPFDT